MAKIYKNIVVSNTEPSKDVLWINPLRPPLRFWKWGKNGWEAVGSPLTETELEDILSNITTLQDTKQDKLIAGTGIDIDSNNKISVTLDIEVIKVVSSLPTTNISSNKIYLVVNPEGEADNVYTEYMYINGKWEIVGQFKAGIDLSVYALKSQIPTKVSQLTNDSNYANKSYVDTSIGNIHIPSKVSELENDRGYLTQHQDISHLATKTEVSTVQNNIPTKVSQLQNDVPYLTEHQSLSEYAKRTEIPTKVSQLLNDAGYLTEHQDLSGKADKTALQEEVNRATNVETELNNDLTELQGRVLVMETGSKVTTTVSPNTIYKATQYTINVSGAFTSSDSTLIPSSISVLQGATLIKEATNAKNVSGTNTLSTTSNTTTYTTKAVVNGVTLTSTANVSARYPIYYGFATSDSNANITNLTKLGATTTATRTYTSTNNNSEDCHFYILVPTDITAPTKFSMGGAPANMNTTSITLDGISYKMIKSGGIYSNGVKVEIAAS